MNKVNKYLIDTFEKIFARNKILVARKGKEGLFVQCCTTKDLRQMSLSLELLTMKNKARVTKCFSFST